MDSKELELLISTCKDLKVLYVEDDDEVRLQTSKMLSIYFKCITQAVNGKDGLEKFKNNKFDVVFTDINMSVMDGISMIKEIKKSDSQIPIVIFSAYDNTEYFLQTIECGIDGYILKPFRFEEIRRVVEKIVLKLIALEKLDTKIKLICDFYWDKVEKILYKKDEEICLTKKELEASSLVLDAK
jgi:YesN/AraC family two-component response regulator